MSQQATIRRYSLEIEKIQKSHYPSFMEIKDYLFDQGFEVSDRTITRDFEQIRVEFKTEITYEPRKRGYYIDYENSVDFESFISFLEIVNTANLLTESLKDSKGSLDNISFDTGGGLRGIENLKPLLMAVRENRKISFSHYNFHTDKTKPFTMKPYLLKEYQNRWYVVGLIPGIPEFRTFGIERIDKLEIKAETFKRDKKLNPKKLFEQTIGLVHSEHPVQPVVLSYTHSQGKYAKTLPLHHSQTVLVDNDKEFRVSLRVAPNYELIQQILRLGETVTVLEPEWLVAEVKGIMQRALDKY